MATRVILDVLENTIGKYVLNLDAKSLNVALWSGKIELHDLKLNLDALNADLQHQAAITPSIALPFRFIGGGFEKILMEVPWTRITSKPVVIRAKGLEVILEPHDFLSDVSPNDANKKSQRERDIQVAENDRRQANELKKLTAVGNEGEISSYSANLMTRIIENIQLEIDDISVSFRGSGCSAGFILNKLSLITTDDKGNHVFVDRASHEKKDGVNSFLYKALNVGRFGLYCDEYNTKTESDRGKKKGSISKEYDHSYIISPFSFRTTLRQFDGTNCVEFPKYYVRSQLSKLSISLSQIQFKLLHKVALSMVPKNNESRPLFPEYRPSTPPTTPKAAREWWKYAYRCIGRLSRRRSWPEYIIAVKKRRRYIPLYNRMAHHAHCDWLIPPSNDEMDYLQQIDHDASISVVGIMTWRNIADDQFEKSMKERAKKDEEKAQMGSFITMLWGVRREDKKTTASAVDDPPITLTDEEMKEIEDVSFDHMVMPEESMICDAKFSLGSITFKMIDSCKKPILRHEIGTMENSFVARNDGSYTFNYTLSNLRVEDLVTDRTLFPMVFRSLESKTSSTAEEHSKAIQLKMTKNKESNQSIILKIVPYEIVVSPHLTNRVRDFFTLDDDNEDKMNKRTNVPLIDERVAAVVSQVSIDVSEALTEALIDTWSSKQQHAQNWAIDCNIGSPVIIMPENCCDVKATVLVLDTGHLRLVTGAKTKDPKVVEWFRRSCSNMAIDNYSLEISNFTLLFGTVGDCNWGLASRDAQSADEKYDAFEAVIEPINIIASMGIEKSTSIQPRTCIFCTLPHISVKTSPEQIGKIVSLLNTWVLIGEKIIDTVIDYDDEKVKAEIDDFQEKYHKLKPLQLSSGNEEVKDNFYVSINLVGCSLTFSREGGESLEAHLVSVSASSTISTNGSSSNQLCMGWFWIIDKFTHSELPNGTRQKLLVHSALPRSADSYSRDENSYDVMDELHRMGVFADDYSGSSELAEIKVFYTSSSLEIMATLSSLYVNWYPEAMANLISTKLEIVNISEHSNLRKTAENIQALYESDISSIIIRAGLNKLQLNFHSPNYVSSIYTITLSDPKFNYESQTQGANKNENILVTVSDLFVDAGSERTFGGLPNSTTDLLTVKYVMATQTAPSSSTAIVSAISPPQSLVATTTNSIDIELSPIDLVYVHARIENFISYITDGILGAITARAASSVTAVALEAATRTDVVKTSVKLRATTMSLTIPQSVASARLHAAATKVGGDSFFALEANEIVACYSFLNESGGLSEMELSAGGLLVKSGDGVPLIDPPAKMNLKIHPEMIKDHDNESNEGDENADVNSEEIVSMVEVNFSEAFFFLSKKHYAQIMLTLDENIFELDPFLGTLRDNGNTSPTLLSKFDMFEEEEVTDIPMNRTHVNITFDTINIIIIGRDEFEPIVSFATFETIIELQYIPTSNESYIRFTSRDFRARDERLSSVVRNSDFRELISAASQKKESKDDPHVQVDVVIRDEIIDVELFIANRQIFVLPDVVYELSKYCDLSDVVNKKKAATVEIEDEKDNDVLKTTTCKTSEEDKIDKKKLNVYIQTEDYRLVFVEMGGTEKESHKRTDQLLETITLQGKWKAKVASEIDTTNSAITKSQVSFVAEEIQIYVARGKNFEYPIQILEPTQFSFVIDTFQSTEEGDSIIENLRLTVKTMSPIDLTLSMQNIILLNAISNSIFCSLPVDSNTENGDDCASNLHELSSSEVHDIERISGVLSELNIDEEDSSTNTTTDLTTSTNESLNLRTQEKNKEKMRGRNLRLRLNTAASNVSLTIINDLQGLDTPLFRVVTEKLTGKGMYTVSNIDDPEGSIDTLTVDSKIVSKINADYYDASANCWYNFFDSPWEWIVVLSRIKDRTPGSKRMISSIKINSEPCHISFSEQFLVSIGTAINMWSVFNSAMDKACSEADLAISLHTSCPQSSPSSSLKANSVVAEQKSMLKKSIAAKATRRLVMTLPYGIDNRTGITVRYFIQSQAKDENAHGKENPTPLVCDAGMIQYFQFELLSGSGVGNKRIYGKDVADSKTVMIYVGDEVITLTNIDAEVLKPLRVYQIGEGRCVFLKVAKMGTTTIIHLNSHVNIHNSTMLPFKIALINGENVHHVGKCYGKYKCDGTKDRQNRRAKQQMSHIISSSDQSHSVDLGIPLDLLSDLETQGESCRYRVLISPNSEYNLEGGGDKDNWGSFLLPSLPNLLEMSKKDTLMTLSDIHCRFSLNEIKNGTEDTVSSTISDDSMCAQICLKTTVVDNVHPFIEIFLQSRTVLRNLLPVHVLIRTPVLSTFAYNFDKHTISSGEEWRCDEGDNVDDYYHDKTVMVHEIEPEQDMEIFCPGDFLDVSIKCANRQVAGPETDWQAGGWIGIPLNTNLRLRDPMRCTFPLTKRSSERAINDEDEVKTDNEIEFFITEINHMADPLESHTLQSNKGVFSISKVIPRKNPNETDKSQVDVDSNQDLPQTPKERIRTVFLTLQNFAVDFTGQIMFEPVETPAANTIQPWSAFSCPYRGSRMTLLPGLKVPICLVMTSINSPTGWRRSLPFNIEDISISEGGLESSSIVWDDKTLSGYYAYRQLRNYNQFEVHIVPEFVIFNGGKNFTLIISQMNCPNIQLHPGKITPAYKNSEDGLTIAIEIPEIGAYIDPIRVDSLGMILTIARAKETKAPIGSLAIQTVVGSKDSRLVVKIGSIKFGGKKRDHAPAFSNLFSDDLIRFGLICEGVQITLNDTQMTSSNTSRMNQDKPIDVLYSKVVQFSLMQILLSFQRVFKNQDEKGYSIHCPERSQVAMIVKNVTVLDCTPKSPNPVVFDTSSTKHFLDLTIFINNSIDADLVTIQILDLSLAFNKDTSKPDNIVINTNEGFVWILIDLMNRIANAISDVSTTYLDLEWNEEKQEYDVFFVKNPINDTKTNLSIRDSLEEYTPPQSDKLFDVKKLQISPISLNLSFKRQPELAPKTKSEGWVLTKVMGYFLNNLKFTLKNANLYFNGYIGKDIKGPPDRILEIVQAVYVSRLMRQFLKIISATSFLEWKKDTSRDPKEDEYVEGDISKNIGNVLGMKSGSFLKGMKQGIGGGVVAVTGTVQTVGTQLKVNRSMNRSASFKGAVNAFAFSKMLRQNTNSSENNAEVSHASRSSGSDKDDDIKVNNTIPERNIGAITSFAFPKMLRQNINPSENNAEVSHASQSEKSDKDNDIKVNNTTCEKGGKNPFTFSKMLRQNTNSSDNNAGVSNVSQSAGSNKIDDEEVNNTLCKNNEVEDTEFVAKSSVVTKSFFGSVRTMKNMTNAVGNQMRRQLGDEAINKHEEDAAGSSSQNENITTASTSSSTKLIAQLDTGVKNTAKGVSEGAGKILKGSGEMISKLGGDVGDGGGKLVKGGTEMASKLGMGVSDGADKIIQGGSEVASKLGSGVSDGTGKIVKGSVDMAAKLGTGVANTVGVGKNAGNLVKGSGRGFGRFFGKR